MATSIVRGRHLIARPDRVIDDGALFQRAVIIEATGRFDEIRRQHDADEVIGGPDHVVVPGLVNAHHHGRGTGAFLGGLADDALERWLLGIPAARPGLDGRLGALVSALHMLRSGTTTVLHNHLGPGVLGAVGGYAVSGMRVAFSSAYIERAFYTYNDDAFLSSLPSDLAGQARAALGGPPPGHDDYFALVDELAAASSAMGARARVLVSPVGIYWATDEFLARCRGEATRRGSGIHMHLLETPYQRAADRALYGKSAVEHLDRLGILGPDVSFAHGVWVSEEDIAVLGGHQCSVCHCPSSNLRLRNGRAPVPAMLEAGVPLALGTDGFALNDDDDLLQEMALASRVHGEPDLGSVPLPAAAALGMATSGGARLTGFEDVGALEVGMRADVVLVDWRRVCSGYAHPDVDPVTLLVYRARGGDVDTVMVDGDVVYRGGRFTRIDETAVLAEAAETLNAAPPRSREADAFVALLTPHLEHYYAQLLGQR